MKKDIYIYIHTFFVIAVCFAWNLIIAQHTFYILGLTPFQDKADFEEAQKNMEMAFAEAKPNQFACQPLSFYTGLTSKVTIHHTWCRPSLKIRLNPVPRRPGL